MKLSRKQLIANAAFCLTLLGVIIWLLYAEYDRPWKQYQKTFNELEYTTVPERKLAIKQLWLKDLNITDRCVTCHQGTMNPDFNYAPQPFKTHSGNYVKQHPVEKFGCVVCHEGQGAALTVKASHGHTENWQKPILRDSFAQSSCGKCHIIKQDLPLNTELSGGPALIRGWRLFQEYNCIGCHKLTGYESPDYVAPPLTSISNKVNREWLEQWLKNPEEYLPNAKMPRFNLNDEEIEYIAEYLLSLKPLPRRGTARRALTDNNGEKLVESLGCLGCHIINDKGNYFGPELSDIGSKANPEWLYQWLKNPREYQHNTNMPFMSIPDDEIWSIVGYLTSLKKDHPSVSPLGNGRIKEDPVFLAESMVKGKKLVKDLGCTGCHEIEKLPVRYSAPELDGIGDKRVDELFFNIIPDTERTLINWMTTKTRYPEKFSSDKITAKMPNYNFSNGQTEALAVFLLSLKKDSVPVKYMRALIKPGERGTKGKKVFEKYNCLGCHKINNTGGDIGPDLTAEAKKSKPEWLFGFIKRPAKIRSTQLMKASMPDYNMSDSETTALIEYLSSVSGESYPYYSAPKKEIQSEDIYEGEKLYQEVFACSACHAIDKRGGVVGPDHTDLASRLKRKWIEQWLKNPRAMKADVRMPGYTFKSWEFEALTNYLMTLGKYRFVSLKKDE